MAIGEKDAGFSIGDTKNSPGICRHRSGVPHLWHILLLDRRAVQTNPAEHEHNYTPAPSEPQLLAAEKQAKPAEGGKSKPDFRRSTC
jgi:hypothetical protein